MIHIGQANEPSEHIRSRSKRMFVKTLAFDSYLVTPREYGKARRLVHLDQSDEGIIKIECVDSLTGDVCPANGFSKPCSHVEAALKRLCINLKREERRLARLEKVKSESRAA